MERSEAPFAVHDSVSGCVDVVIPTFNARDLVAACVERLLDDPAVSSVIVVDDASNDGTAEALEARFRMRVAVVVLEGHRGLSRALNAGARHGSAGLLLFLNNDILAPAGGVTQLAQALAARPSAVAAGGRLVDPGTLVTQRSYVPHDVPGLAAMLVRAARLDRWTHNPWSGGHLTKPLQDSGVHLTKRQLAGGCLMVRRAVFESMGGWDERYWFYYEDVDFGRRLRSYGSSVYVADAAFEHVGGASASAWRQHEFDARVQYGAMVYAQLHLSPVGRQLVGLTTAASTLVKLAAARGDRDAYRSYRWVWRCAAALSRRRPLPDPDYARTR